MSRSNVAAARKPELIICSIDYDGCLSGRKAGDSAENMYLHLRELLIRHPQASIVLMVGSARQSIFSDVYHERKNKNGSCWVYIESFLQNFKLRFADLAERISLDLFLLEDIACQKTPGHHFDIRVNSFSEVLADEYMQREATFGNGVDIQWQDLTKRSLIYAQLHYVGVKYPGKNIAFHFYDDRTFILESLHNLYGLRIELIPHNFSLHLFNYASGNFYASFLLGIQGLGFIDSDYSNNVKKLHSSDWLRSHHLNMTNRVLDEPNLALAIHLYYLSRDKNNFIWRLREKWGCAAFDFLNHLFSDSHDKIMIIESWFLEAIKLNEIQFIKRCVDYVHPNLCVEYFIEALESDNNELASAFVPILNSPYLGEYSRDDISLLLFIKKKYDWLVERYSCRDDLLRLIDWCRRVDRNGLTKSGLKELLNKHYIHGQQWALSLDLKRFCYHVNSLSGDELTIEDRIALRVIVQARADHSLSFEERLLVAVLLSQLSMELVRISDNPEKIKQKYLQACATDYPSEVQKIMIEKIQAECLKINDDALLTAYRALRFAILSVSLPSDNVLNALYKVLRDWKNAESIIPEKTHLQLLLDQDKKLGAAESSNSHSLFSFFCFSCDKKVVFSHEEFLDALPIVAMRNAAFKMERQVPSRPALSLW